MEAKSELPSSSASPGCITPLDSALLSSLPMSPDTLRFDDDDEDDLEVFSKVTWSGLSNDAKHDPLTATYREIQGFKRPLYFHLPKALRWRNIMGLPDVAQRRKPTLKEYSAH